MSWKLALASVAVIALSLAVAVWGFGLSAGRAVLLAPVFIVTVGLAAAFLVVLAKIVRER